MRQGIMISLGSANAGFQVDVFAEAIAVAVLKVLCCRIQPLSQR